MGESERQKRPTVVSRGSYIRTVLPIAFGIVVARLAGDGTRDRLGWWGSVGVSILAAVVVALIIAAILQAWKRRGDSA